MRHRSRAVRRVLALTVATAVPLALAAGSAGTDVTVTVTGVRSTEGVVRACLTSVAKGFPKCDDAARTQNVIVPARRTVTLTFRDVAPGRYAIALLHDENDNGKADRALGMMPKEGFGFSRDAKVRMGPPKFDEAAFDVGSAPSSQTIHMRYMF